MSGLIGIFSSEGICQDLCQTARGFASRLLFSHTTVKSSEDDPDDPERIPFPLQDCPSSSVCHANELQMRPQDPHQGTPTPPLLLATRIFRISRIAGRIPPFNFFKVQTRLSRLQSGSKKNNHSVPAVFQSILPGSILPDSVASNGSRVRFTWSNQRLYLSSNDFEMDTAGFIPSGSSSPLLRPHLQPLLEDLQ